ncbi:MAG TPA: GNAT family N-acetyltransferase [Jiangellaceae bacterium]
MSNATVITDATERNRFEAYVDEDFAGYVEYIRKPDQVEYRHTEVDDEYEGMGVGSSLAQAALDDARRRGMRVLVTCPFLQGWLARHPEYQDLTDQGGSS